MDRSIHSPGEFIRTDVFGAFILLEAAREAAVSPSSGLDRRGLRLDRRGLVHRVLAAGAVLSLLGVQGRRRPPRRRLSPHLRRRCARRSRLEQLRTSPASREADPALHPQRARRRPGARLRRRRARSATGSGSTTSPPRSTSSSSGASAGARLQRRRARRAGEPRGREADPRPDRRRRVADRARRPTAPGTTGGTRSTSGRLRDELGWEPRVGFEDGTAANRRLVPRQRGLVGPDPLRRVPPVLRAPVRPQPQLGGSTPTDRHAASLSL